METETPAESTVLDEAENQSFLGFKLKALIHLGKSVVFQQLRKRLYIHGPTLVAGFSKRSRARDDSELGS
jgi:hypothetical protein